MRGKSGKRNALSALAADGCPLSHPRLARHLSFSSSTNLFTTSAMAKRTAEIIDLVDSSSDSEDREQGIGWLPLAQQHKQQLLQGPGQPSSAASGEVAPAAAAATALHTPALRPPPAAPPPITNSLLAQLARERSGRQRQQQAGGETGPAAAARTVEAAAAGGPAAAADMASANLQPVRLLDLFSGLSTAACGALRAGLRVEA